jgi:hypothetical protein
MNWKRGFKRITHVVAIVIAVACGIIAGFSPVQQYRSACSSSWRLKAQLVIRQPTEKDLADFEKWQQDNKVIIDPNSYCIIPDSADDQTLMTVCNDYPERQRFIYWKNLPKIKLIGMVVLYGLGGAVAGYVGIWVIWYIGLANFILIRWLVLGFREDKSTDEQKQ